MKTESVIVVGVLVIGGLVLLGRREERLPATDGVIPSPKLIEVPTPHLIEPRQPTTLPAINIDIATKVEQRARPQPVRRAQIPRPFPIERRRRMIERWRRVGAPPIQPLRHRAPIPPRRRRGGGGGGKAEQIYAYH